MIIVDIKSNLEESDQSTFAMIVKPIEFEMIENIWMKTPCEIHFEWDYDSNVCNGNQLLYKFIDCLTENNISSKDLFSNEVIESYKIISNYSVIISGNDNQKRSIDNNVYYLELDMCQVSLNFFNTIQIDNLDKNRNSRSFLKLNYSINIGLEPKVYLILNSFNTLKSYQMEYKDVSVDIRNETILVTKTMHQNIKAPYGDCSDYQGRLFNSTNQWQCYRQCIKTLAQKKFNCKPVFIENTLHELDSDYYLDCNSSVQRKFDEYFQTYNISSKCINICPKNCLNIDFQMNVIREDKSHENITKRYNNIQKTFVWDTTQPMFVYKEVPVLSFIEYMVYLGGLVGLWFGTSAKDLVTILLDKTFWLNLWNIFLMKHNSNRNSIIVRIYN